MGDSTTAGTPAFRSPVEAPPDGAGLRESQYAYWLMQMHPEWQVFNRGINGQRTDQIWGRLDRDLVDLQPDAVVIIAGVNDVYEGRDAQHVQRALDRMYHRVYAAGLPLIAGTILPYNTATPEQNARMHRINDWIAAFAARRSDTICCDTRRAVSTPDNPDLLAATSDGLHPSPEGYRMMAVALEPALRRLLAGAPGPSAPPEP